MYAIVCTRCYGYYLPYTFMAPVCDMFNHDHNNDAGLFAFNKECHLDPLKHKSYFKSNKYLNDVRILFSSDSEADVKARADVLTQGFHITDEYWRQRKEATLPGWKDQIEKEGTQAWTIIYSKKEQTYDAVSTYGMEESEEEDGACTEDEEEVKGADQQSKEKSKRTKADAEDESVPLKQAIIRLAPKKVGDNASETLVTVSKPAKNEVVPSEDDDMLWTREVDHENNSYLLLVNHSGRTMKAGEQIMFFYGRYTNAYLLVNYGFCYRDNKYDQIDILLELKPPSLFPKDFITFDFEREEGV